MKKIFLSIPEFTATSEFNSEHLKPYLSGLDNSRSKPAQEYFINTHGGYAGSVIWSVTEFLKSLLPSKMYKFLASPSEDLRLILDEDNSQKAQQVMQTIIDASKRDEINVVHIASCHASLAHGSLDRLDGNICLVTYSNWMHAGIARTQDKLISHHRETTAYTSVLTKYFSEYIASGLEVSYKIDGKIYNYKVDNRDIQSSLLKYDSPDYIPRIISQESSKWLEFYNGLHDKFSGRYSSLFPKMLQAEDCLSPDHVHPDSLIQGVLDFTERDEEI